MLSVGTRVRLHGLKAKPELNGREGAVKERKSEAGRWLIRLGDGAEFALKGENLEVLHPGADGGRGPSCQTVPAANRDTNVAEGFDQLLGRLETTRQSVFDTMVYCMEHASQHAAVLAQRLAKALGKPGLSSKAYTARLFLASDVLHNSRGSSEGASQFGACLQELLPEACEKLGRLWLRKIQGAEERAAAEDAVRQVLGAWQEWSVFPLLFTRGLESLLFAQVFEITAKEAAGEPDELLRPMLTQWFAGMNQAQLPHACQQRGLAGKAMQTATCRARLCHFERYWHLQPGAKVHLHGLTNAPYLNDAAAVCERWDLAAGRWRLRLEDGSAKAVRQENIILDASFSGRSSGGLLGGLAGPAAGAAAGPPRGTSKRRTSGGNSLSGNSTVVGNRDNESIDGEPLTAEELAELSEMEAGAAEQDAGCQLQRGYGVWTQVADPNVGCLVAPADYDCWTERKGSMGRP